MRQWSKVSFGGLRLLQCWPLLLFPCSAIRRTPSFIASSPEQQQEHRQLARTTVTVPVPTDPSDHLVTDLPLLDNNELGGVQHWAGHLPVLQGDKYLFYWLFAPSEGFDDPDTPLIIWLNGGPACSSMDGLFLENGPIRWTLQDGQYRLEANPYSWHKTPAYVLYIDQPVGTGLSFTTSRTYPRNDEEVNVDFYAFLQQFFQLHADKFVKSNTVQRSIYFSGESHAGHYIPSMMNYILQQNDEAKAGTIAIPLAGAAIGNGWVDPYHQYPAARAAYGHGLIDLAQLYKLQFKEDQCQEQLKKGQYTSGVCFDLLDDVVANSYGSQSPFKVSQYDVRRSEHKHGSRDFPPGYKVTEAYLGAWPLSSSDPGQLDTHIQTNVLEALHATAATQAGQRYSECTDPPYEALAHQDGKGVVEDVVAILHHPSQPRLLFFNGIEDLICNHVGNEEALNHLPWEYTEQFMEAKRYAWIPDKQQATAANPVAGHMREFRNLMYLKLFNSGHMVPLDQPTVALAMMQTLVQKNSFDSSMQNLNSVTEPPDASSCPVCPTCKDCPVCPATGDDDDDDDTNSNQSTSPGNTSKPDIMSWAGPLLAVVGCLAVVYSCLPNQRRGKSRPLSNGDLSPIVERTISSRSLELRERQTSYHDDVEDLDKEVL